MGRLKGNPKLIVALDVPNLEEAKRWVALLRSRIKIFKVGSTLFTAEGPSVIEMIQKRKGEVFLDLKFHDIPNTVASACRIGTRLGALMLTLHMMGGEEALKAAVSAVSEEASQKKLRRPLLLGVTLLTHQDKEALERLRWELKGSVEEEVTHLARIGKQHGLDGVVCSPQEIRPIRESCGNDFLIVTPGVRPVGSLLHDQKRVSQPREAIQAGADYIVIGRPILESQDPMELVNTILQEIQ